MGQESLKSDFAQRWWPPTHCSGSAERISLKSEKQQLGRLSTKCVFAESKPSSTNVRSEEREGFGPRRSVQIEQPYGSVCLRVASTTQSLWYIWHLTDLSDIRVTFRKNLCRKSDTGYTPKQKKRLPRRKSELRADLTVSERYSHSPKL